jgi:hypothetical protein
VLAFSAEMASRLTDTIGADHLSQGLSGTAPATGAIARLGTLILLALIAY